MLKDAKYDQVKLLYKLSKLCWFLDKHAIHNAIEINDKNTADQLKALKDDLEKHIKHLEPQCK